MYIALAALLALAAPSQAAYITGDPTRVSKAGDTMTGPLNAYASGASTFSVVAASGVRINTGGLTFPDGTNQVTAAAATDLTAVGASTAALAVSTGALSVSTSALAGRIDALDLSTAATAAQLTALAASTSALSASTVSLSVRLDAVATSTSALSASTAALSGRLDAVAVSTSALAVSTGALSASTVSLSVRLDAVAASTSALSVSTASLQTQIDAFGVPASSGINADITAMKALTLITSAVTAKSSFTVASKLRVTENTIIGCTGPVESVSNINLNIGPDCASVNDFGSLTSVRQISTGTPNTGHVYQFRVGSYDASTNIGKIMARTRTGTGVDVAGIEFQTGSSDPIGNTLIRAGFFGPTEVARFEGFTGNLGVGTGAGPTDRIHASGSIRASTFFNSGDGSASAPAYTFTSEATSGLYRAAAAALGLSVTGTRIAQFKPAAAEFGTGSTISTFTAAGYWRPIRLSTAILCTTAGESGAVLMDNAFDLWTGTGTANGAWRNSRTGAGPC